MKPNETDHIGRYLQKHAVEPEERSKLPAPKPELRTCVTIPVYDELEHIGDVIDSLRRASKHPERFEVIVVVNNPKDAPREIVEANAKTLALLDDAPTEFPLYVVDRATAGNAFPPDRAGVGRARRLAMDLAAYRLAEVGRGSDGIIACVDGDSPVASGYVDAVVDAFETGPPGMLAGVCRYRHPIPDDERHALAIIAYETWMRYFETGLHFIETPYAYQSIGSCMVLSARGYALADGVPTREALSDFYLLQKVAKVGGFGAVRQLTEPMVYPSARPSTRVPRGTGPSVRKVIEEAESRFVHVEPPESFRHLRHWFREIDRGFADPEALRNPAPPLRETLEDWGALRAFEKFRETAPDASHFARHFHQWFDSLKIVKFCNEMARRQGRTWIFDALRPLLRWYDQPELAESIPRTDPSNTPLESRRRVLEMLREHELELHTATT